MKEELEKSKRSVKPENHYRNEKIYQFYQKPG